VVAQALAMLAVVLLGAGSSAMSTVNGVIGRRLGPWRTTWVFTLAGAATAAVLVLAFERHVFDPALLASLPLYAPAPGILNMVAIATVVRVVAVIGTMQTVATVFAGSVAVGLALDHVGAFGLATLPASPARLAGATLLLAGVALLTLAHRSQTGGRRSFSLAAAAAAFCVGAVDNVSIAINARLAVEAGPFATTVAFLAPGAVVLSLARPWRGRPGGPVRPRDAWPGLYNVVAVAGSALLVPLIGMHLTNGTRFAAAVVTGSLLDHVGAFGARRLRLTALRSLAGVLLVAGVTVSLR
jgi:transporter family-2 protein